MNHQERRERRRLIAEHAAENGLASAARTFGVTIVTARSSCAEYNVEPTHNKIRREFSSYRIIADLLYGLSISSIAEQHHISRQRVSYIKDKCVEAGIPISQDMKNE